MAGCMALLRIDRLLRRALLYDFSPTMLKARATICCR